MVAIITEPGFQDSGWCNMILDNLVEQLRSKRIPFRYVTEQLPAKVDGYFLIASDNCWIRTTVSALNQAGIYPILICNQAERIPGCIYSCVCSDVKAAMSQLLGLVTAENRTRIAVYGVNPSSVGDLSRVDGLVLGKTKVAKMEVFLNKGSLALCFQDFYAKIDQFDAVICVNNYAAISLCNHLGRIPEHLRIYSCVKSRISDRYSDLVFALDTNADQFGKAAVSLYETLQKNPMLSSMTWQIKPSQISPAATPEIPDLPGISESSFYADEELLQILSADRLLTGADEIDIMLLQGLLSGQGIADLAEKHFLSESTIKYRLKKMENICSKPSREALLTLARKWLKL